MPGSGVLTHSFWLDTVCFARAYLDTRSQSLITSHGTLSLQFNANFCFMLVYNKRQSANGAFINVKNFEVLHS